MHKSDRPDQSYVSTESPVIPRALATLPDRLRRFAVVIIASAGMLACASKPPPPPPPPPKATILQVTVEARPDINPDVNGRPSPIVLRWYELKSLGTLSVADFFSLFGREKETLGADLLALEEFQLVPGEKRSFEKKLQTETRYVAVVAAFRDLERSQWRASMPIVLSQTSVVQIRLDGRQVSFIGP